MPATPTRRDALLTAAAAVAAGSSLAAAAPAVGVVDTHTHFYDPTRPQGVPWPGKDSRTLYRPVLPAEFQKLAAPHGVVGTVVVEASPWVEDNQWLLDLAEREPVILGVVGRLPLADADFGRHLARFANKPRFVGVRMTHQEVTAALAGDVPLARVKLLADSGLSLDVNGGPAVLPDVARLAEKVPKLTVVVNHLGNPPVDGREPPAAWRDGLKAAAGCGNVWCKLSGLVDGTRKRDAAPADAAFYQPVLDAAWAAFGAGRLIWGSNWPVSAQYAPFATVFELAAGYVRGKGEGAFGKVFRDNARAVYRV